MLDVGLVHMQVVQHIDELLVDDDEQVVHVVRLVHDEQLVHDDVQLGRLNIVVVVVPIHKHIVVVERPIRKHILDGLVHVRIVVGVVHIRSLDELVQQLDEWK